MLENILKWANEEQSIAAVILTGSQAAGIADDYSDYDLAFFCLQTPPLFKRIAGLRRSEGYGSVCMKSSLPVQLPTRRGSSFLKEAKGWILPFILSLYFTISCALRNCLGSTIEVIKSCSIKLPLRKCCPRPWVKKTRPRSLLQQSLFALSKNFGLKSIMWQNI